MANFVRFMSSRKGGFIEPTEDTINGLESLINWCENEVPSQLNFFMNELVFSMALVNQGFAREMSFGPYDPTGRGGRNEFLGRTFSAGTSGPATPHPIFRHTASSDLAWKIPVRRITGNYYLGWKVREVRPGVVQLYNDSREAYFIEFGINGLPGTQGRLVRRPIRKLSLIKTLNYMAQTNAFHRVWADVFKHKGKGFGFTQVVQSPGMGSFGGSQLGRRLP